MVTFGQVILGFAVLVVGYGLVRFLGTAHNNLVDARERYIRAWGNVEVLVERRYEELGDLIDVVREQVGHELDVLDRVIAARQEAIEAQTPVAIARAQLSVDQSVDELYDLADEYPDLEASDAFEELRQQIRANEQRLEDRREFYNDAVARYNARLAKLPEQLFAALYGFERREPFEASEAARDGVEVGRRLAGDD